MSIGVTSPVTGVYTSNGTSQNIILPGGFGLDVCKFEVYSETSFNGGNVSNTNMIQAYWFKDMAAGSAFVQNRTNGAHTLALTNMVGTNGFTLINPTGASLQAALTGSAVSQAGPAVVTSTNTGALVNTNIVRVTKTTGMYQIAGMDFTVSSVTANTSFDLAYLDSSAFAAVATNIQYQILNYQPYYYPRARTITNMESSGLNTIITMSVDHGLTVGQLVRVIVPTAFVSSGTSPFSATGVQSSTAVPATIVAIGAADASGFTNTITVNVNSAGFTFAFPTSAVAAAGISFAQVIPVGEAATTSAGSVNPQNLLDDATVNQGNFIMQLGSSVVGASSDVIRWIAWRSNVQS